MVRAFVNALEIIKTKKGAQNIIIGQEWKSAVFVLAFASGGNLKWFMYYIFMVFSMSVVIFFLLCTPYIFPRCVKNKAEGFLSVWDKRFMIS